MLQCTILEERESLQFLFTPGMRIIVTDSRMSMQVVASSQIYNNPYFEQFIIPTT